MRFWRKERKEKIVEKLTVPKPDRRLLGNVPDPEHKRSNNERRGQELFAKEAEKMEEQMLEPIRVRYIADFAVEIHSIGDDGRCLATATAEDISATGLLVELDKKSKGLQERQDYTLVFTIPPGTMPEGYETSVKIKANLLRRQGDNRLAFVFDIPLNQYLKKRRWGFSVYTASSLMLVAVLVVMLMRVESILYFKYSFWLYLYSLIAASFLLTRYLFGTLYREVPINPDYTPGVSIIIPCFNEEEWIDRTVLSCMNQDYPIDKLEVIVVDDRSTDRSVHKVQETIRALHNEGDRFDAQNRVQLIVMEQNGGKREALVKGVEVAKHDLVVFVDSDSFLEGRAIRHLVQPFQDPLMGGVAGRTDVENKYTNVLTKLQTVRYYIAFRIMKAAEAWFDAVTCLSGPLSCYRKDLIEKHKEAWLGQTFLGQPATFGDDRSMTNFILRTHRTSYQDAAICTTIVPSDTGVFLKQQMRWKRSWLRESLRAAGFIWRKEPFMALFFYIGLIVPIAAPVIVLHNLVYVPIVDGIFPGTFLLGLLLMALLMSLAHMLFRRSKLWIFGLVFCFFYEGVLLWQMPVAWFTFWKSTWGTRETPQDIAAREKKEQKKLSRQNKSSSPLG